MQRDDEPAGQRASAAQLLSRRVPAVPNGLLGNCWEIRAVACFVEQQAHALFMLLTRAMWLEEIRLVERQEVWLL
jgi:hypothetical protein